MTKNIIYYVKSNEKSPFKEWLNKIKDSQTKDIQQAKEYWSDYKRREKNDKQ